MEGEEVPQRDEHLVELAHHLAVGDLKQAFSSIFPKLFDFSKSNVSNFFELCCCHDSGPDPPPPPGRRNTCGMASAM